MSYYGIRKLKTYQDENGKWNFSCDVYDSSIRGWDNKRVWEHVDAWFKTGLDTKEELERYLFENTLDGNIHGTGGRYGCIGWGNRKVKLSEREHAIVNELEKKYHDLNYGEENKAITSRLRANNIPYDDWKKDTEYADLVERQKQAYKEYKEFRYNAYYKRWKEYLRQQNKNSRGDTYIVRLTFTKEGGYIYSNVFVGSYGSAQTTFYHSSYKAKLFKKSIDELKEMFCNNPRYSNIEFIKVTDRVKGTGRRKYVELTLEDYKTLETIKC